MGQGLGVAEPTFATRRNPRRRSWGAAVAEIAGPLFEGYRADAAADGKPAWWDEHGPLLPWQQQVMDVATEVDDHGRLWYRRVIITTPRQSGKTLGLAALMAQKAQEGRQVWYSAQTGLAAWARWNDFTDGWAQLLRPHVTRNTGAQTAAVHWLSSGGAIRPFAPNDTSMHGATPDDVFLDEVWEYSREKANGVQAAYKFGFATRPDPQQWIFSTQGDARSQWFADLVETGRAATADPDSRTAYFEWSIPELVGGVHAHRVSDDDLLELIKVHHPGFGMSLVWENVLQELQEVHEGTSSRQEFIRGYGNLPTVQAKGTGVWPGSVWSQAKTDLAPVGAVGFGIDVDPDGREWSLVAAGRASSGQTVVEVIMRRDGAPGPADVAYVRDRVAVSRPVSLQMIGAGAAEDFADLLESGGVEVDRIGAADLGAAVSRMLRGVEQLQVLHRGQPSLDAAQRAAMVRESGGRRLLARGGTAGITAVQAGMLAAWALDHPSDTAHGPFQIFVPGRSA